MITEFLVFIRTFNQTNYDPVLTYTENQLLQSQMYLGGNHE